MKEQKYFPYGVACRTEGEVSVTSADSAEAFKLGAEKFYNEARLVSKFNGNPNITGVYDCFYENSTVYIVMEYLRGQTLKEYIRGNGILKAPQALFVAKNICNALVVAHSASVLHRDVSPDNIIICDNGGIKLIDFGAARQVVAEHSRSFSVIIKPGFAPPEQYRKKEIKVRGRTFIRWEQRFILFLREIFPRIPRRGLTMTIRSRKICLTSTLRCGRSSPKLLSSK